MEQKNLIFKYLKDQTILNKKIELVNTGSAISINESIIKKKIVKNISGENIYKLATSFYYSYEDENIIDFANELQNVNDIIAIAVLDQNNNVKGIILKKEFFNTLGKAFGRDIYKNKNIGNIMTECISFHEDENIINISEKLKNELKEIDNKYYILVDRENVFSGIFTTKSILIYLSEITQKDLELAERLQKRLVNSDKIINKKNFELAGISKMAKEVGGDYYNVKEIEKNKWIISIFDISGKGISASLLTSLLGGMFKTFDFHRGLKSFAVILNDYIYNTFNLEKYMTGIMIIFHETNRDLFLYDAGHSFIYIFRNSKLHKLKLHPNLPLGITPDIVPHVSKLKLKQDDILFSFTDGLTDQINNTGSNYSLKKIEKLFINHYNKDISEIKNILLEDINDFKKDQYQQDDITFILLKIK